MERRKSFPLNRFRTLSHSMAGGGEAMRRSILGISFGDFSALALEQFLYAHHIFRHIHADGVVLHFGHANLPPVLQPAELFELLDAPVRRVAALDTFVAYAPQLEDAILPQVADVAKAITDLHRY